MRERKGRECNETMAAFGSDFFEIVISLVSTSGFLADRFKSCVCF
jgi:hypothetical protein